MEIPPGEHYIQTGLILSAHQAQAIDAILAEVRARARASLVVLTARDGQFISASGDNLRRVDLVSLGSLIAGDLAASHQIARLAGVYEDCQVVLREARSSHILVADAGAQMILFMLVPSVVPVGWARLIGREAARSLADVVQSASGGKETSPLPAPGRDISAEFDKALGDLWKS
jgi:predicted regulator of Ras-like GTPase activity (Roadblock/LC7/MglB family)